jgi:hypothetical protein
MAPSCLLVHASRLLQYLKENNVYTKAATCYYMMRMVRILCILVVATLPLCKVWGQTTFARNFIAEAKDGKTYLRWTISQGNTCDGISILRSGDQITYTQIGEISGVCGSTDSAQTYLYTDDSPELNKTNFYKLQFGLTGITAEQSVYIFSKGGYNLYPNPAHNQSRLFFSNNGKNVTLLLYNLSGQLVQNVQTTDNYFVINTSYLASGLYLFAVQTSEHVLTGKLVVVH